MPGYDTKVHHHQINVGLNQIDSSQYRAIFQDKEILLNANGHLPSELKVDLDFQPKCIRKPKFYCFALKLQMFLQSPEKHSHDHCPFS